MNFIVKRMKEIMKKQQKWLTFMLDHLVIRDEHDSELRPTFLLKIGRDDSPTCLLPDLVGDLLCIVPLVHVVLFLLIHDGRVILLVLELEYQLL